MAPGEGEDAGNAGSAASGRLLIGERDIVFRCGRCDGELVVDRDGEGVEVQCSHCGHSLIIPRYVPRAAPTEPVEATAEPAAALRQRYDFTGFSADQLGRRLEELKHQLKENRSQDTELRGHVNRATMELHRLQLKMQKIRERQLEIEAEISSAQQKIAQG